jgi:diaminopimelate epimerase
MGGARTGAAAVALDPAALDTAAPGAHGWLATAENGPLPVHLVSVGNPHCVIFVDALDPEHGGCFSDEALARVGPGLATHTGFAEGTNVQLADVRDRSTVAIRIWERGVGPTKASGTSSCAVAVAAVESERCDPGPIRIEMVGGVLDVTVSAELDVVLRGPVREVCDGELTDGFVASLQDLSAEVAKPH